MNKSSTRGFNVANGRSLIEELNEPDFQQFSAIGAIEVKYVAEYKVTLTHKVRFT